MKRSRKQRPRTSRRLVHQLGNSARSGRREGRDRPAKNGAGGKFGKGDCSGGAEITSIERTSKNVEQT